MRKKKFQRHFRIYFKNEDPAYIVDEEGRTMYKENVFKCPICGNTDQKYIGIKDGAPYCRRCISFRGDDADTHNPRKGPVVFKLKYRLSKEQKEISKQVLKNYQNGINTLINAVCGSGKTELVYATMAYALSTGGVVGFAVPRRDVAFELFGRTKNVFYNNNVILVCGNHHEKLEGDIVVLTTHQLFRYEKFFSLLILDEIDAFPYRGNDILDSFFRRAIKRNFVMMSATPSDEVLEEFSKQNHQILSLNSRYHGHKLPEPKIIQKVGLAKRLELLKLLKTFIADNKPVFIFVPTIQICEYLYEKISPVIIGGSFVHSKCIERQRRIRDFRKGIYKYLITTAVLERGVTVKNLQVIIYDAEHYLYDESALVQISGRVGRKYDAPEGEVIFLASKTTRAMEKAIQQIREKNKDM